MIVHRTKRKKRLSSLLSALLCCAMLLSQTPMVFAADGADELDASVTAEAELTTETPQEESQSEDSCVSEPVSLFADDEVNISNAQELADLAAMVNDGTYGAVVVTLTQDIDLSGFTAWTPIGTAEHPFTGDFDGGEYTISGLTIAEPETGNQALFGVVSGEAYIYDLTVEGSVTAVTTTDETTTLENSAGVIGAIDANATDVYVENVTSNVTVNGGSSVGGIVGLIAKGAVAELLSCVNAGNVTADPGAQTQIGVGGVVGTVLSANAAITGCDNTGAVTNMFAGTGIQGTGGIVGYCAGTVEDCTNTGAVTGSNTYYVGGVVGYAGKNSKITGCINGSAADETAGAVSGGCGQGGIVAYGSGSVSGCTNYGAVSQTVTGKGSGGIAYYCSGTITGCVNYGTVGVIVDGTNLSNVGGITATVYTTGTITDCENHGVVKTTGDATALDRNSSCGTGGIAGYIYDGGLVYNSSNSGAVTVVNTPAAADPPRDWRAVGGVVGYISAGGEVQFCGNTGAVSRGPAAGTEENKDPNAVLVNAVAGVAGHVGGTLSNCWSSGTVTYGGSRTLTAMMSYVPAGIVSSMDTDSVVRDCLATGKILLTNESLTADTIYAAAIGIRDYSSTVENCVYYCTDYTAEELTHIQAMQIVTDIGDSGSYTNCFVCLGDQYTCVDDSTYTLNAETFASESGVLAKLNSNAWTLAEGASYPTLLSGPEFQALNCTIELTKLDGDTAAAENANVTAALTLDGSPVSAPYTQAKKGDQFQLTVTVPANTENTLLVVSANDSTRLSGPTVTSAEADDLYIYTITVAESDLNICYGLIDTTKDNTAWYTTNPDATEFVITRPGELVFLGQLSAGTALDAAGYPLNADNFSGKTVRLGEDLDLSSVCHPANAEQGIEEVSWTPITGFTGTFDGGVYTESADEDGNVTKTLTGRHTIKNLYVNSTADNAGLFGYATLNFKAVVNNLIVENATVVTTGNSAAAIIGEQGVAANCTVKNSTIRGADYVGAVVSGGMLNTSISNAYNCTVENCTVEGANYVGGVIGTYYASDSNLTGNKTVNTTVFATGDYAGGIAGRAVGASNGMLGGVGSISMNQVLGGSVTGGSYVGGVAGMLGRKSLTSTGSGNVNGGSCSGAIVTAAVTGSGDYVGGIAGYGGVTFAIYYNYNAETGLGVSTTDETALNVGPISGLPRVTDGDGPNASTSIAALNSCLYLSNVYSEDESGAVSLTAEGFTLDEALYLLQGSSISWELKEDAQYPTFSDTETPTLYKLTLRLVGQAGEGNSVSITPLAAESEGYPYRLYGTEGSEQWTYATENTVIPLTVFLAENGLVTFAPAEAVTVTPAETEGGVTTYTVTLTADTTAEYTFSKYIIPDVSWYDSENPQTSYTIEDEADLRGLIQLVNAGNSFAGITLTLANDLTLEGDGWTPIGDSTEHPFSGIFDGQGHTINSLYLNDYSAGDYAGLFGYLSAQGRISNLTVNGAVNATSRYAGGVVGRSEGTLTNVTSGVSVAMTGHGSSTSDQGYAGGVVGYMAANARLDGALSTRSVTVNPEVNSSSAYLGAYVYMGGLAGYSAGVIAHGENQSQLSNIGYMLYYAGGILGYNAGTVTDCRNTANLSGVTADYLGGIVGYASKDSVITRSGNDGAVTAAAFALGGAVGYATASSTSQTYNKGNITNTRALYGSCFTGGLIGYISAATVGNSYNTGNVTFDGVQDSNTSTIAVGGLVGYSDGTTNIIYNCYNTVTGVPAGTLASSTTSVYGGGLIGYTSATVKHCYALDTVTERTGVSTTKLDSDALKAAASVLSIAFTDDLTGDDSVNSGYPVLHWEVDDPSRGVTLNYHDGDLYTLSEAAGLSLASYYEPDIIVVLSPEEAKTAMETAVTVPAGFDFYGWYADKTDESTKYDPETTVLKEGDSYERYWDLVRVTITLDYGYSNVNGDPVTETVRVPEGSLMERPVNPVYEGHDFIGWYLKVDDGSGSLVYADNAFDFANTEINASLTLYAKWQELNPDTTWYDEAESSFTITTVEQLFGFTQLVNAGTSFAGKTVTLGADIRIDDGLEFHPIGTDATHAFSGVFDGANHTISNLTLCQSTLNYQALFGYVIGGEIKDLTVTGSVTGMQYVAGILAYGKDTALSNLTFGAQGGGSSVTSTYSNTGKLNTCNQAGGVVGTLSVTKNTTVSGLVNYAAVSGTDVGGVLYTVDFGSTPLPVSLTLKDCVNYGNVTVTGRAGGVAAYLVDTLLAHEVVFDGCVNAGDVVSAATATYYAGGILGYGDTGAASATSMIVFTFNECVNLGSVKAKSAGGIVGYLTQSGAKEDSHIRFVKCENNGVVTATTYAGGIVSNLSSAYYASLTDCVNKGTVTYSGTGTQGAAGGISGYMYYCYYADITDCVNEGTVICTGSTTAIGAGGIAGDLYYCYYGNVIGCVNKGEVTSSSRAAGIVDYIYGGSSKTSAMGVTGCVNLGNVTATGSYHAAGIAIDARRYVSLTGCYNAGAVTNTGSGVAAGLAVGYSSSYKITLNSCFNYGQVSAATAANVYSGGYYATANSTYSLANSTYLYALSDEGEATFTATANMDSVSTSATAEEFRDGTVLSVLNAYFTDGNEIWYQGADYPVLTLVKYTLTISDSGHATVTIEGLTANEDGSYTVTDGTEFRFTVTPDSGYSLSAVTVNGEALTAGADGTYSLTVTEDIAIAVSVKRTSWGASNPADNDIEKIISSVAAGTNEKTESPEAESDYDETLDYNDDGKNNLLDILNILYRQEETENSGSDDVQTDNPGGEEAPSNEPVENE